MGCNTCGGTRKLPSMPIVVLRAEEVSDFLDLLEPNLKLYWNHPVYQKLLKFEIETGKSRLISISTPTLVEPNRVQSQYQARESDRTSGQGQPTSDMVSGYPETHPGSP